jgi:hypothetical protein
VPDRPCRRLRNSVAGAAVAGAARPAAGVGAGFGIAVLASLMPAPRPPVMTIALTVMTFILTVMTISMTAMVAPMVPAIKTQMRQMMLRTFMMSAPVLMMIAFLADMMSGAATEMMMSLTVMTLTYTFMMAAHMMSTNLMMHDIMKLQTFGRSGRMMVLLRRVGVVDMVDQENLQAVARLSREKGLRALRLGLD